MTLRSGMWAVMFTDLVASTAQRARVGDARGDELRREHDAIVDAAAAAHQGHVVKGTGDGAMVAFSAAADAVAAAVAIQQRIARRNLGADESLGLRIGISIGDLVAERGDLHGLAANEAARVCGAADAGQIVVSDVVRAVAGSRADAEFDDPRDETFAGLPGPVRVWTVRWASHGTAAAMLPRALVPGGGAMTFTGRADEVAALLTAWGDATRGTRRAAFLSGEPGIGKTRLAAEVARVAHDQGGLVLFGRCDDQLGVPFQPFAEAVDWYVEHVTDATFGRFAGDLARLSPRILDRAPDAPPPLQADPETEQYRLFDATADWLRAVASETPVVVVLDDLHWATRATLLMLRHVLAHCDPARLLVIATYRDTDLDRQHPLAAMLADFRRLPGIERVALTGLDTESVAEVLARVGGQELDPDGRAFAALLTRETEGNPFFVGEILRNLVETGILVRQDGRWTTTRNIAELGIPQGIKEVLGQRLDRLGPATSEVLQAAGVIGREFDFELLRSVVGTADAEVLDVIERAVEARLVEEVADDRYRFAHALVRSALTDELTSARRLRLHVAIGRELEARHPGDVAALADHWLEASFAGDPERAVDYALRAADDANQRGAFAEATGILSRAHDLAASDLDEPRRRAVALQLGVAQRLAGVAEYRTTMLDVARAAEADGDADSLVRAAAGLNRGLFSSTLFVDEEKVAAFEAALRAVPDGRAEDRARLLAGLGVELSFSPYPRRRELFDEARALARSTGDASLIMDVDALSIWALWGEPTNIAAALGGLARGGDEADPTRRFLAIDALRIVAVLRRERAQADDLLGRMKDIVGEVPFAHGRWQCAIQDVCAASEAGRLEEALALAERARTIGVESGMPDAELIAATHRTLIGAEMELASETLQDFRAIYETMRDMPGGLTFAAVFAARLSALGFDDEARDMMDAEVARGFEYFAWTIVSGGFLQSWSEAAADLHHHDAAVRLWERFSPYAAQDLYMSGGTVGAAARPLGRLAITLGDFETAERLLADAEHHHAFAPLLRARTYANQAELLIAQGGAERRAQARDLEDRAVSLCRDHGAAGVEVYVRRVIDCARRHSPS